jgi:hypothetical protein
VLPVRFLVEVFIKFYKNSIMKKSLIPVLLIMMTLAGCNGKRGDEKPAAQTPGTRPTRTRATDTLSSSPTTVLSPPPNASSPFLLTAPIQPANQIFVAVCFAGKNPQLVTVSNGTTQLASFSNAGSSFGSNNLPAPLAGQSFSIIAQVNSQPYINVQVEPANPSGSMSGFDVAAYSDKAGDTAIVIIMDDAITP